MPIPADILEVKVERYFNDFKSLNENQENVITSDIINYLFYINKNRDKFNKIFKEKYINTEIEVAMFNYYLQYVEKNKQVKNWLEDINVIADTSSFMKYFWGKIEVFFTLNPYEIEQTEKVRMLTDTYEFIDEVKIIKNFIKKYGTLENIPEAHNVRIINKIEYLVYHI